MVAAAYKSTLILKGINKGQTIYMPMSSSDVDAAFCTFPDGTTSLTIPSDDDYAIVDLIVITGGTDTTTIDIFKNGLNASIQIVPKANLNTSNNRQFQANPIGIQGGSKVMFKQNT